MIDSNRPVVHELPLSKLGNPVETVRVEHFPKLKSRWVPQPDSGAPNTSTIWPDEVVIRGFTAD